MWHELRALQIMLLHNAIRVPPSFITPTVRHSVGRPDSLMRDFGWDKKELSALTVNCARESVTPGRGLPLRVEEFR
jgi:hypothetical protein